MLACACDGTTCLYQARHAVRVRQHELCGLRVAHDLLQCYHCRRLPGALQLAAGRQQSRNATCHEGERRWLQWPFKQHGSCRCVSSQ